MCGQRSFWGWPSIHLLDILGYLKGRNELLDLLHHTTILTAFPPCSSISRKRKLLNYPYLAAGVLSRSLSTCYCIWLLQVAFVFRFGVPVICMRTPLRKLTDRPVIYQLDNTDSALLAKGSSGALFHGIIIINIDQIASMYNSVTAVLPSLL